jgi:hypothetical protein
MVHDVRFEDFIVVNVRIVFWVKTHYSGRWLPVLWRNILPLYLLLPWRWKHKFFLSITNHTHRYPLFCEFLLQKSMLICTNFSHIELHFCYSKEHTFISLVTLTRKLRGNFILNLWIGCITEDGDWVQSPKILF